MKQQGNFMASLELEETDGLYSGSFRWSMDKAFPNIPSFQPRFTSKRAHRQLHESVSFSSKGWDDYFKARCPAFLNTVKDDPSVVDALSFPLSAISAIIQLKLIRQGLKDMIIIVGGSTVKCEERILLRTNYWEEFCTFFPEVRFQFHFVGPEISATRTRVKSGSNKRFDASVHKETLGQFMTSYERLVMAYTTSKERAALCIIPNPGYGSFVETADIRLCKSWLRDLQRLSNLRIPTLFTCANDYSDLQGEFAVQASIIKSEFLMLPQRNKYCAASYLHEEGKKETSWSCANSFLYVVCGSQNGGIDHVLDKAIQCSTATELQRLLGTSGLTLYDKVGLMFQNGSICENSGFVRESEDEEIIEANHDGSFEIPNYAKQKFDTLKLAIRNVSGDSSVEEPSVITSFLNVEYAASVNPTSECDVLEHQDIGERKSDDFVSQSEPNIKNASPSGPAAYKVKIGKLDNHGCFTVHIKMPGTLSARDFSLDVAEDKLRLLRPTALKDIDVMLPYPVVASQTQADYIKRRHVLKIKLKTNAQARKQRSSTAGLEQTSGNSLAVPA